MLISESNFLIFNLIKKQNTSLFSGKHFFVYSLTSLSNDVN